LFSWRDQINRLVFVAAAMLAGCAESSQRNDSTKSEAEIRNVVLSGFLTALAAEGPVEHLPRLVAQEMDSAALQLDVAIPQAARKFAAYDRGAVTDLARRARTPGIIAIPDALNDQMLLIDDASARAMNDTIAMTGQLILRLSPVGMNADGNRAVVMTAVECGSGCGLKQLIFLSGNRKRWIPVQRVRLAEPAAHTTTATRSERSRPGPR
jgi:hypothetical protein